MSIIFNDKISTAAAVKQCWTHNGKAAAAAPTAALTTKEEEKKEKKK